MVQLLTFGLLVASLLNFCMENQFCKEEVKLDILSNSSLLFYLVLELMNLPNFG